MVRGLAQSLIHLLSGRQRYALKTGENETRGSVCFREKCVKFSLFRSLRWKGSRTPVSLLLHRGGNLNSIKEWKQADTLGW